MHDIANRFLLAAVAAGAAGMGLGIVMGITHDFRLAHVHAHVNLLGWVSLALYGLTYRAMPRAAQGVLPHVHFWLATLGPLLMTGALALMLTGTEGVVLAVSVGALATFASILVFAVVLVRSTRPAARRVRSAASLPWSGKRAS